MPFPVDIAMVKRAECKLGCKLPLGFVAAICKQNGGDEVTRSDLWNLHPIFDDSDSKRIKRTCNDIVHETTWNQNGVHEFPRNVVVIGANGGGDLLD